MAWAAALAQHADEDVRAALGAEPGFLEAAAQVVALGAGGQGVFHAAHVAALGGLPPDHAIEPQVFIGDKVLIEVAAGAFTSQGSVGQVAGFHHAFGKVDHEVGDGSL